MKKQLAIQVRVTDKEKSRLTQLAESAGLSLSSWIRRTLLTATEMPTKTEDKVVLTDYTTTPKNKFTEQVVKPAADFKSEVEKMFEEERAKIKAKENNPTPKNIPDNKFMRERFMKKIGIEK